MRRFRQPKSCIDPYDPSWAWMGLGLAVISALTVGLMAVTLIASL